GAKTAIARPAAEASGTAIGCPALPAVWCCPNGSMPGVTVTGQATMRGAGPAIRDQAIRRAVADAKEQADAAAQAAGVKLGQVLDMQISSSGFPYPFEAGAGASPAG